MSDYSQGKIYKLLCNVTKKIYVGSTTESLTKRLKKHVTPSSKISSNVVLEHGDYEIHLIELFPCDTKKDLLKREQYYINHIDCVNINNAYSTEADHKEKKKKYIKDHIDVIREQRKINGKRFFDKKKGEKEQCELCDNYVSYGKMKRHQAGNRCKKMDKVQCDHCNIYVTKKHITRHKKSNQCITFN